jgi:hypothetical protein
VRLVEVQSLLKADMANINSGATEAERRRGEASRLDAEIVAALRMKAANAPAQRRLQEMRTVLQPLLLASAPRWEDDSPFAIVPKWALTSMTSFTQDKTTSYPIKPRIPAFSPQGKMSLWAEEVLGLDSRRKLDLESLLARYVDELGTQVGRVSSDISYRPFFGGAEMILTVPALGDQAAVALNGLIQDAAQILGDPRLCLVFERILQQESYWGYDLIGSPHKFRMQVDLRNPSDQKCIMWVGDNPPIATPSQPSLDPSQFPGFLTERFGPWLHDAGFTNHFVNSQP